MRRKLAAFTVSLVLLSVAICTNGQQKAPGEFISFSGQFGIMLPPTSPDFLTPVGLSVGDDKLIAWVYRWILGSEQAVIISAIANVDLEAKPDFYLETLRNNYAPGSIINQKKTSFAGHPGLVSVVDTNTGHAMTRVMIWTYLLKNRVYLMSLTLDDKSRSEDHLKLMSTFRLLSPKDVESRLAELAEELTPEPLPQEAARSRPTTDAQDAALKGRVKTIITDAEPYFEGKLLGARERISFENYDEQGNLTKTIDYRFSLPERVRMYGTYEGERAFRELRKFRRPLFERKGYEMKERAPEPKLFKIKYKHDADGQLLEMRVLYDGKEVESVSYDRKGKTATRRYDRDYRLVTNPLIRPLPKTVSTLDANGNSIEDAYEVLAGTTYEPSFQYSRLFGFTFFDYWRQHYRTNKKRYEYKLDDRGNWIQRKTFSITKDKQTVASEVTYRTIIYYQ